MTTRWFVEVSQVDADTLMERYCVEAIQWQHALRQARKLRGDRGPLSRFNIELLDAGYRATDPLVKLRYTVSKAPADAPISAKGTNGAGRTHSGARTAPPKPTRSDGTALTARAPAAPSPAPPVSIAVLQPSTELAPPPSPPPQQPASSPVNKLEPADAYEGLPRAGSRNGAAAEEARALARAAEGAGEAIPLVYAHVTTEPMGNGAAAAPVVARTAPPPVASEPNPKLPGLELISVRREEPTAEVPIAYREFAFAVAPGRSPKELERYARAIWEQVRTALAARPEGKFVQVAIFDHRFEGRPQKPPVAVLAWKDWRGDPSIQIHKPEPVAPHPPRPSPPRPASAAPPAPQPAPVEQPPAPEIVAPSSALASDALPTQLWEKPPEAPVAPAAITVPSPPDRPQPVAPAFPPVATVAAFGIVEPAAPVAPPAPVERVPVAPSARPVGGPVPKAPPLTPRRRSPSEDLIGELFEQMHQLHFMPDLVGGADYVLNVLSRMMPCEGVIVHVFDINAREFVVVRAKGPNSRDVLLHRTPDTFALFREAFRRARALHVRDAEQREGFQSGRWERLGVTAKDALLGAVRQGGRYLGMIELANPDGGVPFYDSELNAIDYICEQFAGFVASKPIVLDEDAVVPRNK